MESFAFDDVWRIGLVYAVLVAAGLMIDILLAVRCLRQAVQWRDRVRDLVQRSWDARQVGVLLVFLLGLHVVGFVIYELAGFSRISGEAEKYSLEIVLQSLVFHVAGLGVLAVLIYRWGQSWANRFGWSRHGIFKALHQGVLLYLAMLPILLFYSWIYQAALRYSGYEVDIQQVAWALTGEHSVVRRAYFLILAAVIAPVFEELLFRGVGLPFLSRFIGFPAAVLVTSALFSLLHFHVASVVPLFVLSVGFAMAYTYTGSILVPIVMHGIFNAVNLGLLFVLRGV